MMRRRMNFFPRSLLILPATVLALAGGAAEFPSVYNSEPDTNAILPTPPQALAKFKLPPGFKATVFAAEPEVQNPIALAWDARGRLWIAENYTYAENAKKFDLHLRDRILIFEDRDNDGRFDTRKVFTEESQRLTSVEVGQGGVWALCPPQLLFFPDRNGDDVPDGPAEVMLDGFNVPTVNYHNFANGLRWGPDGWLYGRCGCSAPGEVGLPGSPGAQRIPLRGGLWRFHPQRKVFETVAAGTMNPWGHDWNEFGEAFFVNTVSGHLWHLIPGAHYQTAHTIDPNPRAYELIDTHADHWHFDKTKGWAAQREGLANDYGGGHSHIGAMIYLGDNWPVEYRGHLFTLNQHGRRANQEILTRAGSGYVGQHGKDEFLFSDSWFRGLDLSYGPDGGVVVLDWSDTGECHEANGVHRTSGRIYKVTFGDPKRPELPDLARLSAGELVQLQLHPNEWYARQAQRQLVDRSITGQSLAVEKRKLLEFAQAGPDTVARLRAMWTLYSLGGANQEFLHGQLQQTNEHIRTWAVRLLTDQWPLDTVMSTRPLPVLGAAEIGKGDPSAAKADASLATTTAAVKELCRLAESDASAMVRLALASALQRLPVERRAELAAPLLAHAEDADDHNLPLMIWYGLIPVAESEPASLAALAADCRIPVVRKFIARRLAEDVEKNPEPLNALLKTAATKAEPFPNDILMGMTEALRGWSRARKPAAWDAFQKSVGGSRPAGIRERVRDLAALFGDGRALDEVKRVALDSQADLATRRSALETLIERRPSDLREICERLLNVRFLNTTAIRGLALFDDPALGERLAASYVKFHPSERPAVIATLVSRPAFALALLEEVAARRIPRADVTPFHARQIRSFNHPALTQRLNEVWGEQRDSSAAKQKFIAELKSKLTPATLALADLSAGRVVFNNACAACHTLYGHGGSLGPDLTGGGRDNLDYLLENIVDPSAVVNADFHMSVVELDDDRTLNGLIASKTERTVTLKTQTETLTLDRARIKSLRDSALSLMPEGLLEGLNETQVRDLIAYLMARSQVP